MTKRNPKTRPGKSHYRSTAPRRRARKSSSAGKRPSLFKALAALFGWFSLGALGLGAFAVGAYMLYLDAIIRTQFEGKRWALPARVYARPLELYPGMALNPDHFAAELALLRYRSVKDPYLPGTFARRDDVFDIHTRRFDFWDGIEPVRRIRVAFGDDSVADLTALDNSSNPSLVRMEPAEIAGLYPAHQEDRVLVRREEIPPVLVDALIAVEDRSFYEHSGVDFKGVTRALMANIQAGRTVQGGSTLTQQLVKNFFLTNERTYKRKLNEMLMALLIEWQYSKDEILEAYSNEVYLGQDGSRAVHGLGLASRFYFDRTLQELDLHHVALLVGLARGPSIYDPRRYPERAKQRRALVLDVMVEQGLISAANAETGKQMPLDVTTQTSRGVTRYPAFLDLVRRQLKQNYREEDLTSEGLKIFTTLNPLTQAIAEQALMDQLPKLEKKVRLEPGLLQGAVIIADTQTGEVKAIIGDRDVRLAGFNRALDAKRPTGSLLKPAVYLTALEYPHRYTLATLLNDATPLTYTTSAGQVWSPKNYDKRFHGYVMLQDALARSYNIATARLGLELDVIRVIRTLQRLGVEHPLQPFPSLLLGAVDLTPFEVTQMYETLASGGFRIPLRTIREVTAADGKPLQRYPLNVEKAIEPGPAYLITRALQRVVQAGTGRSINKTLSGDLNIAGKTGTTDEFRDSWFSGFSGNILTVVWTGRDDNKPADLSGAKGALQVWIEIMKQLPLQPLELVAPPDIKQALIDPRSGYRADGNCSGAQWLPFLAGSVPRSAAPCSAEYLFESNGYDVGDSTR